MAFNPVIVIHGGAGAHAAIVTDKLEIQSVHRGVINAAKTGFSILKEGGGALDAVQSAVVCLEDNPHFNAGTGSFYTTTGSIEMDSAIMDGQNLNSGGVACLENIANPINVARLVMEKSNHVLLVAEGAKSFALSQGVSTVPLEQLKTDKADRRRAMNPKFKPATRGKHVSSAPKADPQSGDHDTVAAIALDCEGNVAYANSTGGLNAKLPGRCGGSAIVGAGGYCDNGSGAAATTGHGESIVRTCLARHICYLMEQGQSPQQAVETGLQNMADRVHGYGGAIALNPQGNIGVFFTTDAMSWASIRNREDKVHYGIYPKEDMVEDI